MCGLEERCGTKGSGVKEARSEWAEGVESEAEGGRWRRGRLRLERVEVGGRGGDERRGRLREEAGVMVSWRVEGRASVGEKHRAGGMWDGVF